MGLMSGFCSSATRRPLQGLPDALPSEETSEREYRLRVGLQTHLIPL
jgi:hypothetical protein